MITKLPDVGRISGATLQKSTTAALSMVVVQYSDLTGSLFELRMPVLDALYLLNVIEAITEDSGYDHLRRPAGK